MAKNSPKYIPSGSSAIPRPASAGKRANPKKGGHAKRRIQDDMPEIFQDRDLMVPASEGKAPYKPLPLWYKILMFALMIAGLLWIIAFYLLNANGPVASWGAGNLVAGFVGVFAGFLMMLRWR